MSRQILLCYTSSRSTVKYAFQCAESVEFFLSYELKSKGTMEPNGILCGQGGIFLMVPLREMLQCWGA